MGLSEQDLAYYAGMMDGEGSFSIQVQRRRTRGIGRLSVHFNPRLTMTLYRGQEVLHQMANDLGGKVYLYEAGRMAKWSMGSTSEIEAVTGLLLPYLRIKHAIAERFLEALSYFPRARANHLAGERTWTLERTLAVAEIAVTLNESRQPPKGLEFRDELRAIYDDDSARADFDKPRQGQKFVESPTHCKRGHPWSSENSRMNPKGYRECRACGRERNRAERQRAKEEH